MDHMQTVASVMTNRPPEKLTDRDETTGIEFQFPTEVQTSKVSRQTGRQADR